MATTTNFGWETPDDTDLVKDGAAAIRTALGGVDTSFVDLKGGTTGQVLAKASNTDLDFVWSADAAGMTNPMTTTGDTIYSSSGSTPARRAIGTTGQVLTVSGGVPTWATPSAGWTPDLTLINAGGTTLSGSATVTVSGISGKNALYIFATGVSSDTAGAIFTLRLNADSGSNYRLAGLQIGGSTYETAASAFKVATQGTAAANEAMFHAQIIGANSTGQKVITAASRANGTSPNAFSYVGSYFGGSAISSVSILTDSGNFDAGTIYVYGG